MLKYNCKVKIITGKLETSRVLAKIAGIFQYPLVINLKLKWF